MSKRALFLIVMLAAPPVVAAPANTTKIAKAPKRKPSKPAKPPEEAPILTNAAPAAADPEPAPAPALIEKAPPPPKAPEPAPAEKPKQSTASVEALRAEYQQLKDALFRSRARRETLENALFSTQLVPTIRWDGGRHHAVTRAEVRLDGVRIWESAEGLTSDKPVALAAKSAPPGPHVLGVRVEVRSRDDAKLGYVSDQSFTLNLPEGKKTTVEITVDESGSAPSYNPEVEVEVSSK
jgi:hypothetical protein